MLKKLVIRLFLLVVCSFIYFLNIIRTLKKWIFIYILFKKYQWNIYYQLNIVLGFKKGVMRKICLIFVFIELIVQ